MANGEHPNIKRVKGVLKKFCETCDREMKVVNRCESHSDREECYYCHLILNHIKPCEPTQNSNSSNLKPLT